MFKLIVRKLHVPSCWKREFVALSYISFRVAIPHTLGSPSVANWTVPPKVALARLVMLVHSGATSIAEDGPFAAGFVAAAATPPVEEAAMELAMTLC